MELRCEASHKGKQDPFNPALGSGTLHPLVWHSETNLAMVYGVGVWCGGLYEVIPSPSHTGLSFLTSSVALASKVLSSERSTTFTPFLPPPNLG